jgi:hypothetical protein
VNNRMKIGIINHQQSFLIYERFYGSDCITCRAKLRDEWVNMILRRESISYINAQKLHARWIRYFCSILIIWSYALFVLNLINSVLEKFRNSNLVLNHNFNLLRTWVTLFKNNRGSGFLI